jgi:hypothetical protein
MRKDISFRGKKRRMRCIQEKIDAVLSSSKAINGESGVFEAITQVPVPVLYINTLMCINF